MAWLDHGRLGLLLRSPVLPRLRLAAAVASSVRIAGPGGALSLTISSRSFSVSLSLYRVVQTMFCHHFELQLEYINPCIYCGLALRVSQPAPCTSYVNTLSFLIDKAGLSVSWYLPGLERQCRINI